ncbi:MAG: hypothetical protein ABIG44_02190 [Planctomycetota bacterium]
MLAQMRKVAGALLLVTFLVVMACAGLAQQLSIYEIQSNTVDGDASIYHLEVVDCAGGICVGKYPGTRPRLILRDPNQVGGWAGIQVKDWIYPFDMFNDVQIGDRVELSNMLVEEYLGTTFLQRQSAYNPVYNILSQGNPLPPPTIVSVDQIPAPLYVPDHPNGPGWYVENHDAEPFESMRLVVRDVLVTQMDLGKALDNYNLADQAGNDCWATDYMNVDVDDWGYHPFVGYEQHFCAVAGVFEQYTRLSTRWDYYQLVTLDTPDLAICGDGNNDGTAATDDLPRYAECLVGPQCDDLPAGCPVPAWTADPPGLAVMQCIMMDLDYDGDIDLRDFAQFQLIVETP